jgi:hypothetical protein
MNPKTRTRSLAQTRKRVLAPQHPAVPRIIREYAPDYARCLHALELLLAAPVSPPPPPPPASAPTPPPAAECEAAQ